MATTPFPPGRWREVAVYVAVVVLSSLIVGWFLEVPWRDLRVPIQYSTGDVPSGHIWVKTVLDNPWLLHNDYLGAPDGQDFHDFPTADSLHLVLLKLLGLALGDAFTAVNVYFLLGFPLTALTTLFVLRRLGVSRGPALLAALLYAFLPYHFLRGLDHLFLAQYWVLPLLLWLALRVHLDQLGRWRSWGGLGTLLVCLASSSMGVYYAYFGCFLLLVAGTSAALSRRAWRSLLKAGVLVGVVSIGVAANVAPWAVYRWQHGPNPEAVHRGPLAVEYGGLKITSLLMPTLEHRITPLAKFRRTYDLSLEDAKLPTNAVRSSLGMLATVGFLFLIGRAVLVRDRTGPTVAGGLTTLTLAAVLLGTMGGFGTWLAWCGVTWIRGYERISIVIAFFALTALALMLDAGCRRWAASGWKRWAAGGGLAVLLVLGVLDQTSPKWFPHREQVQDVFEIDREFVGRIEASVPAGSMIFQLPHVNYPEGGRHNQMYTYDLSRGYLHSRTLRWSFGAMKGRPTALWQEKVAALPAAEMVRELRGVGFQGVYVDRLGYADRGRALETQLKTVLGEPRVESSHRRLVYYDLTTVNERQPLARGKRVK